MTGDTLYVNGEFLPQAEAKISVLDRGFLFADAIYEVTAVLGARLVDFDAHFARLNRSAHEIGLELPVSRDELLELHRELLRRNALEEGLVYLQVTRGAADRDFVIAEGLQPSIVMFTQKMHFTAHPAPMKVVSSPDIRWKRRDVKTVQLLGASLAKTAANRSGAQDCWMTEDGYVTEGSSSNAFIVTSDGSVVTRALSNAILPGITRASVLQLISEQNLKFEERSFTIYEAKAAAEAFITSAGSFVKPVSEIDGVVLGDGKTGPVTKRLVQIYLENARANAI